jgi:hypothetical protein
MVVPQIVLAKLDKDGSATGPVNLATVCRSKWRGEKRREEEEGGGGWRREEGEGASNGGERRWLFRKLY